jgi:hypothetical protein
MVSKKKLKIRYTIQKYSTCMHAYRVYICIPSMLPHHDFSVNISFLLITQTNVIKVKMA